MSDNVETMFSVREVPWHGLGTIVQEKLTAKEALIAAGLDWEVGVHDVFARVIDTDGQVREVALPDHRAVLRDSDDFPMQVCGTRYTPVQNWKSFEFFDTLVDTGDAKYDTAGSLDHGRRIWLTAKVPRQILIGGEDAVDLYLLLANSHDGSLALTAAVTPIRVVCQNTLNLAMGRTRQKWTMRHTESIDGKIDEAREALKLTFEYADQFEEEMNRLAAQEFTKAEFENLIRQVFPDPANRQGRFSDEQYALIGVLESSPTLQDGIRYTKWGALNAIREYDDWGRAFRVSKTKSEAEVRVDRAWFGPNVANANKALAALAAS